MDPAKADNLFSVAVIEQRFCRPAHLDPLLPAFPDPGLTTTECSVPPLPEPPIGHGWFSADEALRDANWQLMVWELCLDGQQVDLAALGIYDDDLPHRLCNWQTEAHPPALANAEPG